MKNKFKKVISLFMSAVMTVSALSFTRFSTHAETNISTEQTKETNDSEIQYGGLLGSMLSDEINESVENNQEAVSQDYVIYKITHDPIAETVGVDYHAKNDCTLFVGFYNDEGTELISSINTELKENERGNAELFITDSLPDHYLIKAFLIGKELLNPLSKPCVYNKYTKQMQEILKKTTEDFDEGKVVNLDNNKNSNFLVTQNELRTIESSSDKDKYVGTDDAGNYLFENIDQIAGLKIGDDVIVNGIKETLIFRIDKIDFVETTAIITPADVEIDEMFSFVKFDSSTYTGETYYCSEDDDASIYENDNDINDYLRLPHIDSMSPEHHTCHIGHTFEFPFLKKESEKGSAANKTELSIGGKFIFDVQCDVEIFYELHIFEPSFISVNCDVEVSAELAIYGEFDKEIKLPWIQVAVLPVFGFACTPHIDINITAELGIKATQKYTLNYTLGLGLTAFSYEPEFEFSKEFDVKATISIVLESGIFVINEHVLFFALEPEIGLELDISKPDVENNDYTRHDCKLCVSITLNPFIRVGLKLKIFNKIAAEITLFELRGKENMLEWHISNNEGFKKGKCNNLSHKIILNVYKSTIDENGQTIADKGNAVSGAKLFIKTKNSDFVLLKNNNDDATVTDRNGQAEVWINDEILTDENSIIKAKYGSNTGCLKVGLEYDKNLNKANSFDIILDNNNEIPEYPKTGNCGVDPSKITAYIGDRYDKDTQCLIKKVNGKDVSIEIPPGSVNYFNNLADDEPCHYIYHDHNGYDNTVTYTLDENGEIRFEGSGYIYSSIIQNLIHTGEIIKTIRIGRGVKTCCNIKIAGTNDDELYGLNLGRSVFNPRKKNEQTITSTGVEVFFEGINGDTIVDNFASDNEYIKKVSLSFFEKIDGSAFWNCKNLSEINMPVTLKTIGNGAFSECSKLENIYFYNALEEIGQSAFRRTAIEYIDVPASVKSIGQVAFYETPLKKIIIRNPECSLGDGFVPKNTVIYGYTNSTAHNYAYRTGNPFVALDPQNQKNSTAGANNTIQNTVTTAATTVINTPVTTQATTVVTNYVSPEKECVMIAVNDEIGENSSANDVLNNENLRFFDQSTADDNGVASFSYVPNENEEWSFMFISEAVNNVIQKTIGAVNELQTITESTVTGDANGDGAVDMSDAVLIMQALAHPNKYGVNGTDPRHITNNGLKYADADGDGFTVNDAQRIQLYLLGKISSLD